MVVWNLPDKELKAKVIKVPTDFGKNRGHGENLNKELENIKEDSIRAEE